MRGVDRARVVRWLAAVRYRAAVWRVEVWRVALAAFLVAGCAASSGDDDRRYEPVARLLDGLVPRGRGAAVGPAQAEVGDVRKTVHSVGRVRAPQIECGPPPAGQADAFAPCTARVARPFPGARWAIFQTRPYAALRKEAGLPPDDRDADARQSFAIPARPFARGGRLPRWRTPGLSYALAPALEDRDFTSRPVAVPEDARLRFSIATEERAWSVRAAPVEFSVSALVAGAPERELFRKRLDPTTRPEDRGWHDEDVSLADLAGKRARFAFRVRPVKPSDARPQLPLWGDPRVIAPGRDGAKRPSIVLISLDTLRARSMSTHGYGLPTTPDLERIARQGTLFTNAFTTFANTLGSHMSMLTGLYPAAHRVLYPAQHLADSIPTLAERLHGSGYQTAAFTENGMISAKWGFARGFAHYAEDTTTAYRPVGASRTFARARAWAETHADERFFLFVHTYAVHSPYEPAEAYRTLFADTDLGADRLRYEQEIREVDDEVARLVTDLDRMIGADRLLLVITADHGEEFWEHGASSHTQLYEEVLHVPLLIRWPGQVPAGRIVTDPVSLVDVAPTILDLAGVPVRGGADGVSLVGLLRDESTPAPADGEPRRVLFAEANAGRAGQRTYVARSREAKCMIGDRDAEPRCFDLRADPDERTPRAADSAELAALADAVVRYRARPRPTPPKGRSARAAEVDDEREKQLRALGYIE